MINLSENIYINILSKPNKKGEQKRVSSYLVGIHAKTEAKSIELAKKEYPDNDFLVTNEDNWAKLSNPSEQYVVKNGEIVLAEPEELSKEELQQQKISALDNEYNAAVKDLSDALMIARLKGDAVAEQSIQADFEELQASYKEERELIENV